MYEEVDKGCSRDERECGEEIEDQHSTSEQSIE